MYTVKSIDFIEHVLSGKFLLNFDNEFPKSGAMAHLVHMESYHSKNT